MLQILNLWHCRQQSSRQSKGKPAHVQMKLRSSRNLDSWVKELLRFHRAIFQIRSRIVYVEHEPETQEAALSCPTLCDPMDSSLPGSSIHGIFQARLMEWAAISFSRSSQPRDQTWVSCIAARCFTV